MELKIISQNLNDYLKPIPGIIDFEHPLIQQRIKEIEAASTDEVKRIRMAFEMARDDIHHSFDTKDPEVTISASDALQKKNGICFAKSHALAALLRGMGIPTGFCYQRVVKKGTPESGFALHGLNAIYLKDLKKWVRADPRGEKEGVHSEFNTDKEILAYPIREHWGEVDYPFVYPEPLPEVIESMKNAADCRVLFDTRPEAIAEPV